MVCRRQRVSSWAGPKWYWPAGTSRQRKAHERHSHVPVVCGRRPRPRRGFLVARRTGRRDLGGAPRTARAIDDRTGGPIPGRGRPAAGPTRRRADSPHDCPPRWDRHSRHAAYAAARIHHCRAGTQGCRCGTCRKPPRPPIRGRRCGTTGPAAAWTGTPPTSSPLTSPGPPGKAYHLEFRPAEAARGIRSQSPGRGGTV